MRVTPGTLRVPTRVWNDNDVDKNYEGLVDDGPLQVLKNRSLIVMRFM